MGGFADDSSLGRGIAINMMEKADRPVSSQKKDFHP
jgi:hypothetical protein